jgi:hypothetical protein
VELDDMPQFLHFGGNIFQTMMMFFYDHHELAIRGYILVEKFGWDINDGKYWILDKSKLPWTRKAH